MGHDERARNGACTNAGVWGAGLALSSGGGKEESGDAFGGRDGWLVLVLVLVCWARRLRHPTEDRENGLGTGQGLGLGTGECGTQWCVGGRLTRSAICGLLLMLGSLTAAAPTELRGEALGILPQLRPRPLPAPIHRKRQFGQLQIRVVLLDAATAAERRFEHATSALPRRYLGGRAHAQGVTSHCPTLPAARCRLGNVPGKREALQKVAVVPNPDFCCSCSNRDDIAGFRVPCLGLALNPRPETVGQTRVCRTDESLIVVRRSSHTSVAPPAVLHATSSPGIAQRLRRIPKHVPRAIRPG